MIIVAQISQVIMKIPVMVYKLIMIRFICFVIVLNFFIDDESDTATEGEEEIRARELRKQEVRVEPPIVQTDTGTDTEVKSSFHLTSDIPDILHNHDHLQTNVSNLSRSLDNVSVNSGEYNSAESGDLDLNMNLTTTTNTITTEQFNNNNEKNEAVVVTGKLSITPSKSKYEPKKFNSLSKSATAGNINKPLRNFVIPSKEKRKSFGTEFVPKFKTAEPEPLLIIKRTPSKISLPKETKPKVAVNTAVLDAKKYFGEPKNNSKKKQSSLKRSETVSVVTKTPLLKQSSLPETTTEIKEVKTFNFEPEDDDMNNIDNYIENLIANEDELQKPIDPKKYTVEENGEDGEKVSSSIEDLLKALETETKVDDIEVDIKSDEKIDDLLNWMEDLEHQTPDRKIYRSYSDAKYKNLERSLKIPNRSASIVSKIPKNNLHFFEMHLQGKGIPRDDSSSSDENLIKRNGERSKSFMLKRSKTEVNFKPRTSVDLDAVSNVDVRKVLQKFETNQENNQTKTSPKLGLAKRRSFANTKSTSFNFNNDFKFQNEAQKSIEQTVEDLGQFINNTEQSMNPRKSNDWCVNITVSTIPNPEYLNIQQNQGEVLDDNSTKLEDLSLITEESSNQDKSSEAHDFLKAIDSSSGGNETSTSNSNDSNSESDTDNETSNPHNFAKAVEDSSLELTVSNENSELHNDKEIPVSIESDQDETIKFKPHNFSKAVEDSDEVSEIDNLNKFEALNTTATNTVKEQTINIEDLYAKVNKPKKENQISSVSPPVPRRLKKLHTEVNNAMPQRPLRQRSIEQKQTTNNCGLNSHPIVPQRKKSSPLTNKKISSNNASIKKEVVKSFNMPKPSTVEIKTKMRMPNSESANKDNKSNKNKDKDCCIQ